MRIEFIPNYIPKINYMSHPVSAIQTRPQINGLSGLFYYPLNFGSNNDFEKALLNTKDVHCPCCGVKMISKDEKFDLLEDTENIETTDELLNYLDKNREYFNPRFHTVIDIMKSYANLHQNVSPKDLIFLIWAQSARRFTEAIKKCTEQMDVLSETDMFSQLDKQKLRECKNNLLSLSEYKNKNIQYKKFCDIMQDTFNVMENPQKWEIYNELKTPVSKAMISKSIVYADPNLFKDKSLIYNFIYNVLSKSEKNILSANDEYESDKILVCTHCSSDKKNIYKLLFPESDWRKQNISNYLNDISKNFTDNKQYKYQSYNCKMLKALNKISKGALSDVYTINQTEKSRISNSDKIDFEPVKLDDIPCAICGKKNNSLNQKRKLNRNINDASDLYELNFIINKNRNLIRGKYLSVISDFQEILKSNPNISEDEMLEALRKRLTVRFNKQLDILTDGSIDRILFSYLSHHEKEKIRDLRKYLTNNFKNQGNIFPYEEFSRLINDTFKDFSNMMYYITAFKDKMKRLNSVQYLLYPSQNDISKNKSPLRAVLCGVFDMSVSATSHLEPVSKSGDNSIDNYIVLCKDCHTDKRNKDFKNWYRRKPYFKKNIQNQIDFINQKIKKGQLSEDYLEYLSKLSKKVYDLSDGDIELYY